MHLAKEGYLSNSVNP